VTSRNVLLFVAGLSMVWIQILVALEMDVSLAPFGGESRMAFQLLLPFAIALTGVGAVIAERWRPGVDRVLRLAGVGVLVLLGICLAVHLAVHNALSPKALVRALVYVAGIGLPLLMLSIGVGRSLLDAHLEGKPAVGRAIAVHLAGLLIGYATLPPLLHEVGANAGLFALGVSLLVGGAKSHLALPLVMALSVATNVDAVLEQRRVVTVEWRGDRVEEDGDLTHALLEPTVHLDWGLYHQFRVAKSKRGFVGFYGWMMQWVIPVGGRSGPEELMRQALYALAGPDDQILLLCAGGGRGLVAFPFRADGHVTTVERVENVVRWLRTDGASITDDLPRSTNLVAADARFVLDTRTEPVDFLVIESGRYQPMGWVNPVGSQDTLYTFESFERAASLLAPDGLFLVNYHNVDRSSAQRFLSGQENVRRLGLPFVLAGVDRKSNRLQPPSLSCDAEGPCMDLYIVAAKDRSTLDAAREALDSKNGIQLMETIDFGVDPRDVPFMTDARPFGTWEGLSARARRVVRSLAAGIAGVLCSGLGVLALRGRAAPRVVVAFAALGLAWIVVLAHAQYQFRTLMTGPMQTTLWVTAALLGWGTIGSLVSSRISGAHRVPPWIVAALAVHFAALQLVPFHWASSVPRAMFLVLSLAPAGLACGAAFPVLLRRVDNRSVATALLADALGTGIGAMSFYFVCLPFGFGPWFLLAAAAYVVAFAAVPK
jgi:hypothetical protein